MKQILSLKAMCSADRQWEINAVGNLQAHGRNGAKRRQPN